MALNFQDKYGHQALDAKQHYDHLTGNAIVSGVAPSAGSTGLEVDIASGTAIVNSSETSVSSQTVTLNAADSTNPRKDVITIDSTGSATVYTGTAESRKPEQNATKFDLQRPAPDDLNGVNEAVVAEVFVAEGATTLASDDVRDRRNIASAVAGSLDMYGDIDMGSNSITSVNQVDGVDVTNHSSRHESGGSDEITFGSLASVDITAALYDTAANRPTAGTTGRIFFETDTGRTLYDDGTSWVELGLSESQISGVNINDNSLTVGNTSISLGGSGSPEVDNLSGNNGTAGQFLQTNGTNLSFADISGGMTDSERQAFNDVVAQLARNDFEDNLTALNYDGGFYEIFKDESKIVNAIEVTIKTLEGGDPNGVAELLTGFGAPQNLVETLTDSTDTVFSVAFSGDGFLAVGSGDNNVYVYDTSDFSLQETLTDSTAYAYSVAFSGDGYLAVGEGAFGEQNNVYVYDTSDFSLQETLTDSTDRIFSVAFSGDGYLAVGNLDNNIYVYDTSNFSLQQTLSDPSDRVRSVAFSSDGFLAAGGDDRDVYVYETSNFTLQETLTNSNAAVYSLGFSSEGFLAAGRSDSSVHVYNTSDFTLQETLTDGTSFVYSVAFGNGFLAAGYGDNNVYVYDTNDFSLTETLTDSTDTVFSVAFSGDGFLAVGSDDNNVYVYEQQDLSSTNGTIEWSKNLSNDGFSNPPSNVVASWETTLPTDTGINIDISDGTNTVNLTEADIDSEVNTSALTSENLTITAELTRPDTDTESPVLDDLMLHFKE